MDAYAAGGVGTLSMCRSWTTTMKMRDGQPIFRFPSLFRCGSEEETGRGAGLVAPRVRDEGGGRANDWTKVLCRVRGGRGGRGSSARGQRVARTGQVQLEN